MNIQVPFAPLLDLLLKSAALILIGAALIAVLRKTSAANRHAVSVAIFATLLLLPFTKLMPAHWSFALEKPAVPAVNLRLPLAAMARGDSGHSAAQPVQNVAQPARRTPLVIPWRKLAVAVWLAGTALLLARRGIITLRLRRIVRRSFPIEDGRLAAKVRSLVDACGVRAEVRESDRCPVPLASGLARPVVLLPTGAADWSDAFISSALRHELGHIRRRDCITRLLADLLCALYWVNPLVWFAARQMRLAQEQACDDLVLNSGAAADEYAGQLVDIVRSLQGDRFTTRHALAMAQPSTLETRVLAIVDAQRDRSARSVRGTFAGITFIAATLVICTAAQLRGADERKAAPAGNAGGANEPARKQVFIEAKFVEITGDNPALPKILKAYNPMVPPEVGILTKDEAGNLFRALNQPKGVDLLSAPRITTLTNQPASVQVVREFIYPTEWDRNAKTGRLEPTVFEKRDIGIKFGVTPGADAEGGITLKMAPEYVELEGFVDLDADATANLGKPDATLGMAEIPKGHRSQPVFNVRKMEANVTIRPEQTVILGGMERVDVQTVEDTNPGTGRTKISEVRLRKRLFVLVTASIVKPDEVPVEKPGDVPVNPAGKSGAATETKPLEIVSDKMTFDKKTGALSASGNVKIETAQATITAAQAEITPKKTGAAAAAAKIIFPRIDFRDSTVREAVEFLVAKSKSLDPERKGVNVVLSDEGKASDVRITLSLSNVPLGEALRYVASLAGLWLREDEFAIIIGQSQAGEEAKPIAGAGGGGGKEDTRWIFPKLEFRDATMREAVDFLIAKSRTLDGAGTGANILLKDAEKIGDVKVTLSLTDIPLAEVLRYLAALANCEVVREEFAFVIGPMEVGKAPAPNANPR